MPFNSLWTWELVNILHTFVFVLFLNVDHVYPRNVNNSFIKNYEEIQTLRTSHKVLLYFLFVIGYLKNLYLVQSNKDNFKSFNK